MDDGDDEDAPSALMVNGDLGPELPPAVIPPDDIDSGAPAADVAPEHVPAPTAPAPTSAIPRDADAVPSPIPVDSNKPGVPLAALV